MRQFIDEATKHNLAFWIKCNLPQLDGEAQAEMLVLLCDYMEIKL